ncbi:MAG: efflux RND transporter permease subunit [Pseudomonadota bacterium]
MLTRFALANRSFILFAVIVAVLMGPFSFLTHPSREDPAVVIRNAAVVARFPGMSADRIEDLITRPLEEKVREIVEVDTIESTSTPGQALINVTVDDIYTDMQPIWADLRNKMEDVAPVLPEGTQGPFVDDDKGNVAMATIALTGEGWENWEMHEIAKDLRRDIYALVEGVRKIDLFGVLEERIYLEFDSVKLSELGLDTRVVIDTIQAQNVVLPGGSIEAEGLSLEVEPSGDFETLEQITDLIVALPDQPGASVFLKDVATLRKGYEEPPGTPAYYNGRPTIVLSISMIDGFDSFAFGAALKAVVAAQSAQMPLGFETHFITYQPDDIGIAIFGVLQNLWQTVVIVLIVVVAFLGLRAGLIVGAMVPLVMVLTVLVMRQAGIELERMSLASLIIALGLLVDNGIVVAEEIEVRLQEGMERVAAALAAGKALATPLLAASVTTILAFMPLMLAPGGAGEYTRSISLVIALALIVSWVVALTALILFCVWFLKPGTKAKTIGEGRGLRVYRDLMGVCVNRPLPVIAGGLGLFGLGVWLMGFVGATFFPNSERTQLQVQVNLPVGSSSSLTAEVTQRVAAWALDKDQNPEVTDVVGYVANGGPRFYLALAPIDGTPDQAYLLINVQTPQDVAVVSNRLRGFAADATPEARIIPKPMSMGPNEAGLVEYRVTGEDAVVLAGIANRLQMALRETGFARDVKQDWENPTVTIRVIVDQQAARRAGVTSQDIANALNTQLSGVSVTDFRTSDVSIPVVLRAIGDQRTNLDRLRTLSIGREDASAIPLLQVAQLGGVPGFSRIQRRDLQRVITVSAVASGTTAVGLDAMLSPVLATLSGDIPFGYSIEKGGEIEGSSDAQARLFASLPLALCLMLLVLILQFDSLIKPVIIFLTIPLVLPGVALALLLAPGANFSFMGILGLLALMGIVINNAIVLIDRIEIERDGGKPLRAAIIEAGVQRLRPIVMTTCTTSLGLLPIILARDVLFYDLALVVAGGLLIGTLLTLVFVPSLFALFFIRTARRDAAAAHAA